MSVVLWMASTGRFEILHADMAKPKIRDYYEVIVLDLNQNVMQLDSCDFLERKLTVHLQIDENGEVLELRVAEPIEDMDYSCVVSKIKTWKIACKQNKIVWLEHHLSW
jgi:hypothetical protein